MCLELVKRASPLGFVVGVDVDSKLILRGAERVAGVVELQDVTLVLFVPHNIPRADVLLVHHLGVIDDTDHTVEVGHGVYAALVVVVVFCVLTEELGIEIFLCQGDIIVVKRSELVLLDESLDHIVRGDYDVVADCAPRELGIHILVGGVGRIADLDSFTEGVKVPFFKLLVGVYRILASVGDVFSPVVNVERGHAAAVA